jgi:hypothetical protein
MLIHRTLTLTISLVVLALVPGTSSAEAGEVKLFRTPMVLEVPVAPFDSLLQKEWVAMEDMARYQCEGVSLRRLRLRARRLKDGSSALQVKADIDTIEGEDKRVDLLFELVVAGGVVASERIEGVDAEESTSRGVSAYLEVPGGKLAGQTRAVLKITVTVAED